MQIINMKNITSEIQLSLDEIKSRLDIEKEKIIEPEGLTMKQKKKKKNIYIYIYISMSPSLVFFISYITYVRKYNTQKNKGKNTDL